MKSSLLLSVVLSLATLAPAMATWGDMDEVNTAAKRSPKKGQYATATAAQAVPTSAAEPKAEEKSPQKPLIGGYVRMEGTSLL